MWSWRLKRSEPVSEWLRPGPHCPPRSQAGDRRGVSGAALFGLRCQPPNLRRQFTPEMPGAEGPEFGQTGRSSEARSARRPRRAGPQAARGFKRALRLSSRQAKRGASGRRGRLEACGLANRQQPGLRLGSRQSWHGASGLRPQSRRCPAPKAAEPFSGAGGDRNSACKPWTRGLPRCVLPEHHPHGRRRPFKAAEQAARHRKGTPADHPARLRRFASRLHGARRRGRDQVRMWQAQRAHCNEQWRQRHLPGCLRASRSERHLQRPPQRQAGPDNRRRPGQQRPRRDLYVGAQRLDGG